MQNTKTIAAFFQVNQDTSYEAFMEWLKTCPFSHTVAVDFNYNPKTEPAPENLGGSGSQATNDDIATENDVVNALEVTGTSSEVVGDAPVVDGLSESDVVEVTEEEANQALNPEGTGTEAVAETPESTETQVDGDSTDTVSETVAEAEKSTESSPTEEEKAQE